LSPALLYLTTASRVIYFCQFKRSIIEELLYDQLSDRAVHTASCLNVSFVIVLGSHVHKPFS